MNVKDLIIYKILEGYPQAGFIETGSVFCQFTPVVAVHFLFVLSHRGARFLQNQALEILEAYFIPKFHHFTKVPVVAFK